MPAQCSLSVSKDPKRTGAAEEKKEVSGEAPSTVITIFEIEPQQPLRQMHYSQERIQNSFETQASVCVLDAISTLLCFLCSRQT